MKKIYLAVISIFLLCETSSVFAQTYVYNFNNTLNEQGGAGPALTEYFTNGATTGNYSNQNITTSSGTCGTQPAFNFNFGGGLLFDNSSNFIGNTYTINMLFQFNSIPGITPSHWQRVINFDSTNDAGIYSRNTPNPVTDGCIQAPDPGGTIVGTCPNQTAGTFVLFTLVRDGVDDSAFIYINGALFQRILDGSGLYIPPASPSSILFFIDNTGDNEVGDGSIRYLSLSPNTSTDVQVLNTWNNLCNAVLPLHLIDFTANKQTNSVNLDWTTISEVNTSHFEIERSSDGNNFIKLANVQAKNTPSVNKYNYIDAQPLQTNFYRLKMVDKDGHFTYSAVLKVGFSGVQKFGAYPNPAKDAITVVGVKENAIIKMVNMEGKILLQKQASGQSLIINIDNLSSGLYILQYFDGEKMQTQKFVKE